jgi:cytochrome c oxidase subunit I+III
MLSERLGRWVFWLMFAGFNIAFLPMHVTGLLGMPRRVWTYPADLGWDPLNMISTVGAYVLGAGVLLFVIDLLVRFRPGQGPSNPWRAGTLEWLPNDVYSTRSIPLVTSREPIWDQPNLAEDVAAGAYYLPGAPTGGRETLVTSPVEALPQYVIRMPGAGWPPFLAAFFTAACFLILTVKIVIPAIACGVLAIVFCLVWTWSLDPGPGKGEVDVGGGIRLPTYMTGSRSHSWWAVVVLIFVAASLYLAYVFSYLFLWTVSPEVWAPAGSPALPGIGSPVASAALLLAGSGLLYAARRALPPAGRLRIVVPVLVVLALACLVAALGIEIAGHWQTGLRPAQNAYGASVYLGIVLFGQLAFADVILGGFVAARHIAGRLDRERRVTFDNLALLFHYTVAQSLVGLALLHGFPRLVA